MFHKINIFFVVLLVRAIAQGALGAEECPVNLNGVRTVAEGCNCNPAPSIQMGMCRTGFVCGEPWAGDYLRQMIRAPPGSELTSPTPPLPKPIGQAPAPYICHSCVYGQYCPEGSVLPPSNSSLIQMALSKMMCPPGKYCPTPGEAYNCPSGSFCAQGTVAPVTCNITTLVQRYPLLLMPTRPTSIYESVYVRGTTLAGNQCPFNSSTPNKPCESGYYCPTPNETFICPNGFYCKQGVQEPAKCPKLASCPEGSAKATLSWIGFIFLAVILIVLWLSYWTMITFLRVNQRRLGRTQAARERLWKLLTPMFASQNLSKSQAFRAFKAIRPKITIEFEDLGLTLHDGTPILSGVSGKFSHSRVAAVMGPSGAGKSTFLNVIMGKASHMGKVAGSMRANGREARPEALRAIVGFVPQEDIVHEDLTVRENLVYSARLRLSAAKPLREQLAIVDDVVNVLQLRHVQHQVVGSAERRGISGGQRKRVNIGWELVAKPSVLFMDEPTSGLDATAAADILGALKRMAGLGMNIITVIHQPRFSIFTLFDDVMLLCKGGRLAYLGPSQLALPYMQSVGFQLPPNENPADFALDVLSGSVARAGFPAFQPEDLVPLWTSRGESWIQTQLASGYAAPTSVWEEASRPAVDPEQLRLLEESFNDADGDGDGAINRTELKSMLVGMGVEPTGADIQVIVNELAEPASGLILKSALLQYVRYGGRPPTLDAAPPPGGTKQRRVDSLYRVYSIEQYTLGNALAEMAAAQLPAALKAVPEGNSPATLKEMAAAANSATSSSPMKPTVSLTADGSTGVATTTAIAEEETTDAELTSEIGGATRTSTSGSVASLQLPAEDTSPSPPHPAFGGSGAESRRTSMVLKEVPLVQEPAPRRSLRYRFLSIFSLEAGNHKLRSTPGVFGQLVVLLSRASIKWTRNWTVKLVDLLLLIVAAVACGAMHGTGSGPNDIRGQTALVMLTLGILAATTSLSVFGRDKIVFWREHASGVSVLPYFLANTAVNLIDVALQPLVFISIYHSMTLPSIPFGTLYLVGMLVVWWTSSAGCLISILIGQPANALVAAVAVVMIAGGFINGVSPNYRDLSDTTKMLTSLSYNRWAVEAVVIESYEHYPPYMWPLTKALVNVAGYCGLDKSNVPSINGNLKGNVIIASDAPAWDDPWEQADATIPTKPSNSLEQQDITVYCAGYAENALLVIGLEGVVLRLCTLMALYLCPRGLTLEPLVVAVGSVASKIRSWFVFKRKEVRRRRTITGGPAGSV